MYLGTVLEASASKDLRRDMANSTIQVKRPLDVRNWVQDIFTNSRRKTR
jgi:hypothetical protein